MPSDGRPAGTPPSTRELVATGWELIRRSEFSAALAPLRQACAVDAQDPSAQFLRGASHHALDQLPEALAAFDLAVQADPAHREAALGAIAVLCQLGRAADALPRCARLAALAPHDANVRFTTGVVHEARGDLAAALACYDAALALDAASRPALLNRGLALTRLGRLDEAYENNLIAARSFPAEPDSHFNLAEVCLARSMHVEAVQHCDRALDLAPRHVGARFDRGLALAALGRLDEAEASFAAARALDARAVRALETRVGGADARPVAALDVYVARGFEALNRCDWSARDEYLRRFAEFVERPGAHPLDEPAAPFQAMAAGLPPMLQRQVAAAAAAALVRGIAPLPRARARVGARLRVGYVSPDFRDHPVGYLSQALFEAHDRAAVEVFAYALSPEDRSPVRHRIAAGADEFRDLSRVGPEDGARRIRADGIDVLVDLAGHTDGSRPQLLAARPAAVTMAYLGFPGTTGAPYVDHFIADPVTAPAGNEPLFTERVVRLPRTFWVHDTPAPAAQAATRGQFGLPDESIVLCAFHNGYKIGPQTFDAWCDLLQAAPEALLWLLDGGPAMTANLRREAAARRVDPARLRFAPRAPRVTNLARLACADLFVDAFHYNGGANALDALWAGLPVLTCRGASFAARMAASAVLAVGLPELVTDDPDAYRAAGRALIGNPRRLAVLRSKLASARGTSALFDTAARARELETAYAAVAERSARGHPPAALDVVEVAGVGGAGRALKVLVRG